LYTLQFHLKSTGFSICIVWAKTLAPANFFWSECCMPLHTAKETLGADQRAVVPHLKMAVVAGGNTGGPHITNDVTALNRLPHTASQGRHMPVKRGAGG